MAEPAVQGCCRSAAEAIADPGIEALIGEVRAGRRKSIARLMSLAESSGARSKAALAELHRYTGRAHIVGLTGVPGSGKSTMVRALTQRLRASGRTVGIVAIDPSSPFSGGAILGDRIRMLDLAGDDGVFIRSMATRGALGGLARATLDVVDVLDAAGFDVVVIETVGVGQDEVDIVQAAHTVVVVSAPGLGDQIQAIKAGVLEIADVHVVSKCDRIEASETVADLRAMLRLGALGADIASLWKVPVVATSAQKQRRHRAPRRCHRCPQDAPRCQWRNRRPAAAHSRDADPQGGRGHRPRPPAAAESRRAEAAARSRARARDRPVRRGRSVAGAGLRDRAEPRPSSRLLPSRQAPPGATKFQAPRRAT